MRKARSSGHHILRVAIGITFLWIGVLIFREPEFWAGFIQPWMINILPVEPVQAMYGTAILDIAVGFFLLIDVFTWVAAFVGAGHLLIVLIVAGIDSITVRDIGLFGGAVALFWEDLPDSIKDRWQTKKEAPVRKELSK